MYINKIGGEIKFTAEKVLPKRTTHFYLFYISYFTSSPKSVAEEQPVMRTLT